jgi:hypothetical protein
MGVYGDPAEAERFRRAWAKTGKRLAMGKARVRFKKLEDLPLEVIGETIRRVPAKKYIKCCVEAVQGRGKARAK